jgi:hypothetical protein
MKNGIKVTLVLATLIMTIYLLVRKPETSEEVLEKVANSLEGIPIDEAAIEQVSDLAVLRKKPLKSNSEAIVVPTVADKRPIKERQKIVAEKIENLSKKLDGCREKISGLVKEDDLQKLESKVWDIEDGKNKPNVTELRKIESEIMEKIGVVMSVEWHMDEVAAVTSELMNEELASSDPEWTLQTGTKLRPCGVYNTHRLLSMWTDIIPPKKDATMDGKLVEESIVSFAKSMLKDAVGAAGVAMQVELLASLAEKGYFSKGFRDSILELEKRMGEDLDAKFEGTDGNSADLVKSIIADYQETEFARNEFNELINQYYHDL